MALNSGNHQLYLFNDFPGREPMPTYDEAESQLKSHFQLLKDEILDFYFPSQLTIQSSNQLHIYATNWALRVIFDFPITEVPLFRHFVIPLKTIFKMKKIGHKKAEKVKFGIKFFFSSGCHLFFKFPEFEGLRSQFKERVKILKTNALKYEEQRWVPNPSWVEKLSMISEYDLMWNRYCKTYPRYFLIPSKILLYFIRQSSHCRSHKRFPFISYFYVPLKSSEKDKVALLRSSQPLNMMNKMRSSYEQQYLASICGNHDLTIVDCRSKKKAVGYQIIGKGYESKKDFKVHISNVHFQFLGIPHAYKIRSVYISMVKKIFHRKSSAFKKWGKITMRILRSACFVANQMSNALNNVLVHCSNGWDRTAQICSLSQLMIDPNFRTLKGFIELIQKEWIDMGHRFTTRCAYVQSNKYDESSPMFAIFIDAVAQLMNKYPNEFEFNLTFLEIILSNAYSQLFGDFIGNNHNERMQINRPTSLFLCFDDAKFGLADKIKNSSYTKSEKILLIEQNDNYKFFADLIGSPVFFSNCVPLIKDDPPGFPNFKLAELEKISFKNQKERRENAIHEKFSDKSDEEEEEEEEETNEKNETEESVASDNDSSEDEEDKSESIDSNDLKTDTDDDYDQS